MQEGLQESEFKAQSPRAIATGGVAMERSLFEKYGGFAVISRIVMDLYDRLLEDDDVGPFFENVDLPRIVDHQTQFVSALMGGPASFTDEQIRRLHERLDINDAHFDQLKVLLAETLGDHGVAPEDIDTVAQAFEQRRGLVVG